jgi:hypothetical protein
LGETSLKATKSVAAEEFETKLLKEMIKAI